MDDFCYFITVMSDFSLYDPNENMNSGKCTENDKKKCQNYLKVTKTELMNAR